jgi:hypothetical protein
MTLHWTYEEAPIDGDLRQGDVLARTAELVDILGKVLPYFCDERYTGFLVVTQDCDLALRKTQQCKARHINLAVIREVEPLIPTLIEAECGTEFPSVYRRETSERAVEVLRKIINLNDQSGGLFYLHNVSASASSLPVLATPSVALLRVTISLRREHYDALRRARQCRLTPVYALRLGWLVGNLYSRVATPDWEDQENNEKAAHQQAARLLEFITEKDKENWVPSSWLAGAKGEGVDIGSISLKILASELKRYAPPPPMKSAAKQAGDVAADMFQSFAVKTLQDDLLRDETVNQYAIGLYCAALSTVAADRVEALRSALAEDQGFRKAISYGVGPVLERFFQSPTNEDKIKLDLEQIKVSTSPSWKRGRQILERILEGRNVPNVEATLRETRLYESATVERLVRACVSVGLLLARKNVFAQSLESRLLADGGFKDAFRINSGLG